MENSVFIRTTAFGGFDKTDVDRVFKKLNTQIFELRNELKENQRILSESENGKDADKIKDDIVSEAREELSAAQAENEMLKKNIEGLSHEVTEKDETIKSLNDQIAELKKKLDEADKKIENLSEGGSAALSKVFIEAQKSADMLVSDSQAQADTILADAKKLVENMVTEANNKASEIVYDAEKKAAETDAESKNNAAAIEASSVNVRAAMLKTVKELGEEMAKIKEAFEKLEKGGTKKIAESETLLAETEETLKKGGIPQFTEAKTVKAELPEPPKPVQPDYNYESVKPKTEKPDNTAEPVKAADEPVKTDEAGSTDELSNDLNKLMAMAESISNGKLASAPEEVLAAGGELDLDSLLKQAESI